MVHRNLLSACRQLFSCLHAGLSAVYLVKQLVYLGLLRLPHSKTNQYTVSLYLQIRFLLSCCTVNPPKYEPGFKEPGRLTFASQSPVYKNLFSLKVETGSYFLKSTLNKILYTWANKISQHSGSSLETQVPYHTKCNVMLCRFYIRNELNTTKYSNPQCNLSSENMNLFKILNLC